MREIERLMAQHGDALLRMCVLHLRDVQLAEDAVQETFLRAWRKWDTFRGECSEGTWLTQIAINVCRDMLRTAWLRHIDRRVDIARLPECARADDHPDRTVLNEVMRLSARHREVILLRYYRGDDAEGSSGRAGDSAIHGEAKAAQSQPDSAKTLEGVVFR